MLLEVKKISVPAGQKIFLQEISWADFESILEDLGERRVSRIAYCQGMLEIMTPLAEHENDKELISDLIKVLLEESELEFAPLGSTTFKNELMQQGIEPDNCFYIQNEAKVRGKKRLDLSQDPPPDLVLEVDVTSRTHPDIYLALGVGELWRFDRGQLQILLLEGDQYIESNYSKILPKFCLVEIIPYYLEQCKIEGRNKTMKAFRNWLREN